MEQIINGYTITENLFTSSQTLVYRGRSLNNDASVIIKICRSEYPSLAELAAFRNHYTLTCDLTLPGVVQARQLVTYGHGYALFLEDVGGVSLSSHYSSALDLSEFFAIALQLVDILDGLHRHPIIHRDLNPDNILIQPDSGQVYLTDFSIASRLPREIPILRSPTRLEGTLAYLSPEQTGRMNRGIDYRSDFYSLGISFFELLTGQLPFRTDDPMALVHSHIALSPPLAEQINPHIPSPLSALVAKLMAKNPGDRYQSLSGIRYDLQRCQTQWQQAAQIDPFEIGRHDISDQFTLPERLYGRDTEVQQLLTAFERVAQGQCKWVLVAGHSGIGKTVVVNEIHKPIVRQQGYFIRGKFEQFQRDVPLLGFVQALADLMGQLLSESDRAIATWREKILAVTGNNGQLMLTIIPQLESIIGEQPPVTELFGSAAQERFNQLLKDLLQIFAAADHPLVIFLDDLQWADSASLQFLTRLLNDPDLHHLLIVGAYRDNEVSATHPLSLAIDRVEPHTIEPHAVEQHDGIVQTLILPPLQFDALNQLVADTLSCSDALAAPLGQLVLQKTQGSPFFATQFLQSLYEQQLLSYEPTEGYWQFDIAQVKALATTHDVVTLVSQRLQQLPPATQQIVKRAACLGNQFDLSTLAMVCNRSIGEAADDLWPALREGLVLPTSEVYRFFQGDGSAVDHAVTALSQTNIADQCPHYRFLHDRVQQAAYELIPLHQRAATHLSIGQRWLGHLSPDEYESHIFELVRHLNVGHVADPSAIATDQMATLNFMAGKRAKASAAYDTAISYYQLSQTYLGDQCWQTHYTLTFQTQFERLQVEHLLGHYVTSEDMAYGLLPHLKTTIDTANVYDFLVKFYSVQNRIAEAIETGFQALELLNITLSPDLPIQEAIAQFPLPQMEQVAQLPTITDPVAEMGLQLLMSLCTPGYASAPSLYRRIVFTMLQLCQKQGYAAPAAHAYVSYGMTLCSDAAEFDLGYQAGQIGLCLVDRFRARNLMVKVNLICQGQIHHWTRHLSQTISGLEAGITAGIDVQDLEFATYCLNFLYLHTCRTTDSIDTTLTYQAKFLTLSPIKNYEQEIPLYYARIWHQYLLTLNLRPEDTALDNPYQLVGTAFDETVALPQLQQMQARVSLGALYVAKTMLAYTFGAYPEAVKLAQATSHYLTGLSSTLVPLHNAYYSLACLAILVSDDVDQAYPSRRSVYLDLVDQNQQQLYQWATSAPMNYGHLYQLVEAERYWVLEQPLEAMTAYDRAIAQAKTHHFLSDQALAYERAARFYLALDKPLIAQKYGIHAYYSYARWGAYAKVAWLETYDTALLEPGLYKATFVSPSSAPNDVQRSHPSVSGQVELNALMQASRILSQEIHLDQLLAALLKILREHTGAEKCVLILVQNNQLMVQAQSQHQHCQLLNQSIEASGTVPLSLVNYVSHTQDVILINGAVLESNFAQDPYIQTYQPQSLLCAPILNQGKLIGLVYLENTLATGVFTNEQIEVIHLLCAQASISIKNASLYAQEQQQQQELKTKNMALEQAVREIDAAKTKIADLNQELEHRIQQRTQELETINQTLQEQIIERQQIQEQLKERETHFSSILNCLEEVVCSRSAQTGQIFYLNPAAEIIYGRPIAELMADPDAWEHAIHPDDREAIAKEFTQLLEIGELHVEYRILQSDGDIRWLSHHSQVIYDNAQAPSRINCTLSDITEQKHAENRLIYDAMHDELTGLPNRTFIMDRIEVVFHRIKCDPSHHFALLFIDFDRFKSINDNLGHLVGDHLLIYCAQILRRSVRTQDTVARLGGDEFVILLDKIDDNKAPIDVAQRIQDHFRREIIIDGHTIFTSASIGIVLGTPDYTTASDLLRDADIAMYRAKANGRACFEVFAPAMRNQAIEGLLSENALRLALENNQLKLHYQPILFLKNQQYLGFEALLRWQHPERGLLLPDQFLPIAMKSELMSSLGFWVLHQACYQVGVWYRKFPEIIPLKMSINISDHLIYHPTFLEYLDGILMETKIPPQSLCLELAEATIINDYKARIHILNQIKKRKINLAIDDFGTGYSSLIYLQRFPFNYLKIDRSVVHKMNDNPENIEIIKAIITLAQTLGKTVIAEGIEVQEEMNQLSKLGCELGQGFLFSHPLPIELLETKLSELSRQTHPSSILRAGVFESDHFNRT